MAATRLVLLRLIGCKRRDRVSHRFGQAGGGQGCSGVLTPCKQAAPSWPWRATTGAPLDEAAFRGEPHLSLFAAHPRKVSGRKMLW